MRYPVNTATGSNSGCFPGPQERSVFQTYRWKNVRFELGGEESLALVLSFLKITLSLEKITSSVLGGGSGSGVAGGGNGGGGVVLAATGPRNIGPNVVKMSLLKYLNNSKDVQQRGRDARADVAPGTPSCHHFSHSPPPPPYFNEILLPKLQEEEKEGATRLAFLRDLEAHFFVHSSCTLSFLLNTFVVCPAFSFVSNKSLNNTQE
ncbi:hypothetical protein M0802_003379 [Mischocyttarus mexicanus]|nr:hypothetical protein M0802_003379 [Mischocyttarus mexicanus]